MRKYAFVLLFGSSLALWGCAEQSTPVTSNDSGGDAVAANAGGETAVVGETENESTDRPAVGATETKVDSSDDITTNENTNEGNGGRSGTDSGGGGDPQALFERSDADGDGKLAGDEVPFWMARADTDEDGAVTLEEFNKWREEARGRGGFGGGRGGSGRGRRGGGFDPQAMFEQRDGDGDGKLSGEELPEWMARADTDEDGAVTLEEFNKWREEARGRGGFGGASRKRESVPDRPKRPPLEDETEEK